MGSLSAPARPDSTAGRPFLPLLDIGQAWRAVNQFRWFTCNEMCVNFPTSVRIERSFRGASPPSRSGPPPPESRSKASNRKQRTPGRVLKEIAKDNSKVYGDMSRYHGRSRPRSSRDPVTSVKVSLP